MRPPYVPVVLAVALASCRGGGADQGAGGSGPLTRLAPTAPMPLSPGNLDGQDEDPAVLVARGGGALHSAWYSNRAGLHSSGRERKEIFVARSVDGVAWTDPPVQVTDDPEADDWSFYPSLAQSEDGVFHLTWMRWHLLPEGCADTSPSCSGPQCCNDYESHILYNRSSDGLTWNTADEVELAQGMRNELPCVVASSEGRLLVYFNSPAGVPATWDLFVAVNDGTGWELPQAVTGVGSSTEHDVYPHVVERSPGSFLMTWTRHPSLDPLFSASSETMLSTSSDGLTWTAPISASGSSPATIDVFPYLYPDHARQSWSVLWVTQNGVVTQRVPDPLPPNDLDPANLGTLDIPGYTPRVAPSPTPGIYWAAWAQYIVPGQPTQKVRHRFLSR